MSRSLFADPELAARHDAAFRRAMERRREAVRATLVLSTPASEEMACPMCRERFLFGNECPECEVPLRSESLLPDVYEAPPRPRRWVRLFLALVCFVAAFMAWYVA